MDDVMTACGEYRILMPTHCSLAAGAVERFRRAASTGADCIYPDIEVRLSRGKYKIVRRPDWSPDTLLSCNYLDGPIAVRRTLLDGIYGDAMMTARMRYSTMLRITERAQYIRHIPEVLAVCDAEPLHDGLSAVENALRRRHVQGYVEHGMMRGAYAVRYPVPVGTRVSCIVYGYAGAGSVRVTLESIVCRSIWQHMELIVADNRAVETGMERYYAALKQNKAARVLREPDEPSVAHLINCAAELASGDALLLLPAGVSLHSGDAALRMLELALRPHVGAVGGVEADDSTASHGIIHNVRAFDGVMMTEAGRFFRAGGLDETFAQSGAIRAYTLLNPDRRLHNVITPYAAFRYGAQIAGQTLPEMNKLRIQDMRSFLTC